jgi:pectate lyase
MNCDSSEGDNIGMQQNNSYIWVHNNDLFYGHAGSDADQIKGDGALDNKGTSYATYSYNHF